MNHTENKLDSGTYLITDLDYVTINGDLMVKWDKISKEFKEPTIYKFEGKYSVLGIRCKNNEEKSNYSYDGYIIQVYNIDNFKLIGNVYSDSGHLIIIPQAHAMNKKIFGYSPVFQATVKYLSVSVNMDTSFDVYVTREGNIVFHSFLIVIKSLPMDRLVINSFFFDELARQKHMIFGKPRESQLLKYNKKLYHSPEKPNKFKKPIKKKKSKFFCISKKNDSC